MKRILESLTVLWLLAVLARFAFYFELRQALGVFLDWIPGLFLLAAGVVLVAAWIVRAFVGRRGRALHLAAASVLVGVIALLWGARLGSVLGAAAHLWRMQDDYLAVVEWVRTDPAADPPECRDRVTVEAGPPLRVAFSMGGLLDNWTGIVHDPSGGVVAAGDPGGPADVRDLFGGTLIHARHLWGPWFLCSFT